MPTTWKFVATPEVNPTVLLDMNDGATWKTLGGDFFKLPSPPLKRSIVSNAMTDGGIVTSSSYDLRELKFTLELTASTEAGRIAQMDALKRELSKPSNLLMYQPRQGSTPVFFRTFRSDDYDLDNQFIPDVAWRVECSVLAEPFAIGVRHDITTGLVVQNNPASGANPALFDITGVRGDSPAPAFVRVGSGLAAGATFVLGQRTANNPTAVTTWAQCEGGTLGVDTVASANDTTMSGAGSNYVTTSFATNNNLVARVTVTVPTATSSEALRGRYRVFVKVRRSATSSAFTLRYNLPGGSSAPGPLVSYDTGYGNLWAIDLGVVDFPSPGPAPQSIGYSGLPAGFATQTLEIQARRTSGTLSLDMDYVYLVPADERSCSWRNVSTVQYAVLDGPNDATYGMPAGSSPFGATRTVDNAGGLINRQGGTPMLVPGVTNRWHVLRPTHNANATSTWDVSYWPRWREVATS